MIYAYDKIKTNKRKPEMNEQSGNGSQTSVTQHLINLSKHYTISKVNHAKI